MPSKPTQTAPDFHVSCPLSSFVGWLLRLSSDVLRQFAINTDGKQCKVATGHE